MLTSGRRLHKSSTGIQVDWCSTGRLVLGFYRYTGTGGLQVDWYWWSTGGLVLGVYRETGTGGLQVDWYKGSTGGLGVYR